MTDSASPKPKRVIPVATPEMLTKRVAAFEAVRKLNPYRDITDPVAWQREIREDAVLARQGIMIDCRHAAGHEHRHLRLQARGS